MEQTQTPPRLDAILSPERFPDCRITYAEHAAIRARLEKQRESRRRQEIDSIAKRLRPLAQRVRSRGDSSKQERPNQHVVAEKRSVSLTITPPPPSPPRPAASPLSGIQILPTGCIGKYDFSGPFGSAFPNQPLEQFDPGAKFVTKVARLSREARTMSLGVAVSRDRPGSEAWELGDMNRVEGDFSQVFLLPSPLTEPTMVTVEVEVETPGQFTMLDSPAIGYHNAVLHGTAFLDVSAPVAVEQYRPLISAPFYHFWELDGESSYYSGGGLERRTLTMSQTIYLLPGAAGFFVTVGAELRAMRVGDDGLAWINYAADGPPFADFGGTHTHLYFPKVTLTYCRYKYFPRA